MIIKKAIPAGTAAATEADLALINQYTLTPLAAEQVYIFAVKLCDNAADRDNEAFSKASLETLQPLYVGKPGIFDHCWSAKGQTARIFRTEVVEGSGTAALEGEPYCYLKAWAYVVRTEDTEELIAKIDGGILREVSVGCACKKLVCSVCGKKLYTADCQHRKGDEYDGKLCLGILTEPTDAYEWSFVAVPAQPAAGVTKGVNPQYVSSGSDTVADTADEDLVTVEKLRFGGI